MKTEQEIKEHIKKIKYAQSEALQDSNNNLINELLGFEAGLKWVLN